MNNHLKFFTGCVLAVACVKNSSAQNVFPDSAQQLAYNKAVSFFYKEIQPQKLLYNGSVYRFHPNSIRGNAYFNDNNSWTKGTVVYDSIYYDNESLMYDIYGDVVAVLLPDNYSMLTLQASRLSAFSIGDNQFINLNPATNAGIKQGIYEQIYAGKVWVLGKYGKTLQSSASTSGPPEQFFRPTKDFYIKKDGKFYSAGSESAVLKAFEDKKKELQQFIKSKEIKFRKNPEMALKMVAAEYDRLTTII